MKTSRSLMSVLLAVISIMSITGCETFGPKYTMVKNDTAVLPNEKGRIVFYRPSGLYGYGGRPAILLNGKKVGTSRPGTVFFVDVDPGKWQVTVPAMLYPGKTSINITILQHETAYVKTSMGPAAFAGRTDVEVVNSEKALTEIDGLEFMAQPTK